MARKGGIVAALSLFVLCRSALAGWEPVAKLKAPDPCEGAVFGYSASTDNGFVAISAPYKDDYRGAVYIYKVDNSELEYMTTLFPPGLNDTNRFGYSVCVDANRVVVGAYKEAAGNVYVFDYNGTEWSSNPQILSVAGSQDYFGYSVSIDGNTIVIGATGDISSPGAAYVFDYDGAGWDYKQTLTDPEGSNGSMFGSSVSIDTNVIVVGVKREVDYGVDNYRRGSVLVFRRVGGSWIKEQKIIDPETERLDSFGCSVSLCKDTFVAGATSHKYGSNEEAGIAFVYKWSGSSWIKEAKLYSPSADVSDAFGNTVAIDDNSIIVGEMRYDGNASNSGAAFLFERNGSSWSDGEIMEDTNGSKDDYFGYSVAIDGEMVMAGTYKDDGGVTDSGAAFVFLLLVADLNQDGIVNFKDFAILANQWLQEPGEPSADIAPLSGGDNIVNMLDLMVLTEEWLKTGSPYIP